MDIMENGALYTNDFRVLCDITLRELQSLQLKESQTMDYLGLASSLVAMPIWKGYRKADFAALLDNLSVESNTGSEQQRPSETTTCAQVLTESIKAALLTSP